MSRFWAAASDSDSDEGSSEYSEDENQNLKTGKRFEAAVFESDSESEDEVRVVKSQKDKTWGTMFESIIRIRNAMKNNDWSIIQDEFEGANKQIEKSKMLIMKEGLPKFYVKMLMDVEDFLQTTLKDKDGIKQMKKHVSTALNRMKLTVRKHNKNYEAEIADCRANPDKYQDDPIKSKSKARSSDDEDDDSDDDDDSDEESEEEDEDESEDEEEESEEEKPKKSKPVKAKSGDESDDSELWDEDDESLSDASSEDDGRPELKGRAKWLKKATDTAGTAKKEAKHLKKIAQSMEPSKKKKELPEVVKSKSTWRMEDNISEEAIDKKVSELVASRGRKGTDSRLVLRQLEMLAKAARVHGPRKEIPVIMHLISGMFDSQRSIDDFMDIEKWRACHRYLIRVLSLLEAHPDLVLKPLLPNEDVTEMLLANNKLKLRDDEKEEITRAIASSSNSNTIHVGGSIESFIILLEDEYIKSLQQINPHTQDYVVRLADEALLFELAECVQQYYIRIGDGRPAANVALMQLEHLYYKHDTMAKAILKSHLFAKTWGRYSDLHPACLGKVEKENIPKKLNVKTMHPAAFAGTPTVTPPHFDSSEKIDELCSLIYKLGDERCKTRALLCAVFHHALHDRYYRARDLFLISHVQDTIDKADTKTQILYNRALVMMGLAAFRQGLIQKAHDCLATICSGRVRELLAQGQARSQDKDPEQEKAERRRQMPYHMHINPDLLDCCHLTCAMLLELPQMAKQLPNQMIYSKPFRRYLQMYNRQVFTGPPENTREHVLIAAKCLLVGDWKRACEYLINLEVWNLIPNYGGGAVKDMLKKRLREEGLRLYLLSYNSHYESISLSQLCEMFDSDPGITRRIISRMIYQKEIFAAWDSTANADILVLYKVDPTPLQTLCVQVGEKLGSLVESNERLLDSISNNTHTAYNKDDWNNRDGRKTWTSDRRGAKPSGERDADKEDLPRYRWGYKAASNFVHPPRTGGASGRGSGSYRGTGRSMGVSRTTGGSGSSGVWSSSKGPGSSRPYTGTGGQTDRLSTRPPAQNNRSWGKSESAFGDSSSKKSSWGAN